MNRLKFLLAAALLTTGAIAQARPYQGDGKNSFCPAPAEHERYVRFLYWFIPC